jgi:hypothetical protein
MARETGRYRETNLVPMIWAAHSNTCHLCEIPSTVPRGRPKKKKIKGRPAADDFHRWSSKVTHHIRNLHTPVYAETPLEMSHFQPSPYLDILSCQLCNSIPNEPIQILECQHLVCKGCLYKVEKEPISCRCTDRPLVAESLCPPSDLVCKCLDSLLICCDLGCGEVLELQYLLKHKNSKCTDVPIPPPSKVSVEQVLQLPTPSQLQAHTTSLIVEKLVPVNGHLTCRSSTGKVQRGVLTSGVIISMH